MHPTLLHALCTVLLVSAPFSLALGATFRAGAFSVDINPPSYPVRVNAMFTERSATNVVDSLFAKSLVLEDGQSKIALCVVDTCMMARDLIDTAKAEASRVTGIPVDRMMVSATHTHSAPSAMGCLGSRIDPRYAAFLPGRIAASIIEAHARLAPAQMASARRDLWEHTFNRRWIRRPDKLLTDPFGDRNVRAHMHPGHESIEAVGPSGPVDPELSVLAFRHRDGRPLAVFANFSQHYYGSPLLSSDYFSRFSVHLAAQLGADDRFVGIMSQGTSGDLMWMDYGAPRREMGYDAYAKEIALVATELLGSAAWQDRVPIRIAEKTLPLNYRAPNPSRLAWAREHEARLGENIPQTLPEIYAMESIYLHEKPRTELKIQALRIGDIGIAALPNEVFALTGLKIKHQSPIPGTFNVELANGAEGYIPPPEQHRLGGYTTWPARTAGLETNAEPRIVETALSLLEKVSGKRRRPHTVHSGSYADKVRQSKPSAYWRLEDMTVPVARDSMGHHPGAFEGLVALWLPGADGRIGHHPSPLPIPNAFSGGSINRSVHFAGGRMASQVSLGLDYSISLWVWNGLPSHAREVTGYFYSRENIETAMSAENLCLGGTNEARTGGSARLILQGGHSNSKTWKGKNPLGLRTWHHVTLVRTGERVRVYLDGQTLPEIDETLPIETRAKRWNLGFGGRPQDPLGFEGRLDEIAVFPRALSIGEIRAHFDASQIRPRSE